MWSRFRETRWAKRSARGFAIFAVMLILVSGVAAAGLVLGVSGGSAASAKTAQGSAPSGAPFVHSGLTPASSGLPWQVCNLAQITPIPYALLGPGCNYLNTFTQWSLGLSNYAIETALYNYLNLTASGVANVNATMQELLSYFVQRAQSVIPQFLGQTWTPAVQAQVAIDSGLIPAIEGLELALGEQQWQIWNATIASVNHDLLAGGCLFTCGATLGVNPSSGLPNPNTDVNKTILGIFGFFGLTRPWQYWSTHPVGGSGQPVFYFNLMPGGTIINANITNGTNVIGNFTVTDVTQHFSFFVPSISGAVWDRQNQTNIPTVTSLYHIGQFDLLQLTCNYGCSQGMLEASGGYAMMNVSSLPPTAYVISHTNFANDTVLGWNLANEMLYQVGIFEANTSHLPGAVLGYVPAQNVGWCFPIGSFPDIANGCSMYNVNSPPSAFGGNLIPTEGSTVSIGGAQPGSVNGIYSLTGYPSTMQSLYTNSMTFAEDYYYFLSALTKNGTYAIPPDCAIPTPGQAFPDATDFKLYQLNAADIMVAYLSYLNAVARAYGTVFTNGFSLCGTSNLAVTFNWSALWKPNLNITASVYVGGPGGPEYLNGTSDPTSTLSNYLTWPVVKVDPALLYPFDFQMNVPVGQTFPVPVNDPLVALLINYKGNLYYGSPSTNLTFGLPTYLELNGSGNYVGISGVPTNIASGGNNASGDAIYISLCVAANGTHMNPCDLAVTYYNNFTYGIVHALLFPVSTTPGGGGGGGLTGTNDCGFGNLNQWYDAWAGYIGAAVAGAFSDVGNAMGGVPLIGGGLSYVFKGIGCVLAWLIVILLIVGAILLVVWIARKAYDAFRGN